MNSKRQKQIPIDSSVTGSDNLAGLFRNILDNQEVDFQELPSKRKTSSRDASDEVPPMEYINNTIEISRTEPYYFQESSPMKGVHFEETVNVSSSEEETLITFPRIEFTDEPPVGLETFEGENFLPLDESIREDESEKLSEEQVIQPISTQHITQSSSGPRSASDIYFEAGQVESKVATNKWKGTFEESSVHKPCLQGFESKTDGTSDQNTFFPFLSATDHALFSLWMKGAC